MFCYFYDNLPNVLTLKVVYQGLEVVECLGVNVWTMEIMRLNLRQLG